MPGICFSARLSGPTCRSHGVLSVPNEHRPALTVPRGEIHRKIFVGFDHAWVFNGEMQTQSDAQLLRDYAENARESAFREIVARHADLVYSAALRQVASPDLARDVAQSVFTDLARKAGSVAKKLA